MHFLLDVNNDPSYVQSISYQLTNSTNSGKSNLQEISRVSKTQLNFSNMKHCRACFPLRFFEHILSYYNRENKNWQTRKNLICFCFVCKQHEFFHFHWLIVFLLTIYDVINEKLLILYVPYALCLYSVSLYTYIYSYRQRIFLCNMNTTFFILYSTYTPFVIVFKLQLYSLVEN